jgi:hypothetical protein
LKEIIKPSTEEKKPQEADANSDDFELELDYDCTALTLEQSIKQVFSIVNSVKIPSIERH